MIPFGQNFNVKDKIFPTLPLEWENFFKLLGIDIDSKLQTLDYNFERVHGKTKSLINDWRSRRLPIQGRINISKCMLVSQYTYVATILAPSNDQIENGHPGKPEKLDQQG